MDNTARCLIIRRNIPKLFQTNAVYLRLDICIQSKFGFNLFGKMPARTLGKNRIFGMEFHAGLVIPSMAAIVAHPHVAGSDTFYRAIVVVKHFSSGKSRKDFDAQIFRLTAQPATQIAKASSIGTFVVHERWGGKVRHTEFALCRQHPMLIIRHGNLCHRAALLFPVRNQLINGFWVKNGARKNMRTDFRAFFEDTD